MITDIMQVCPMCKRPIVTNPSYDTDSSVCKRYVGRIDAISFLASKMDCIAHTIPQIVFSVKALEKELKDRLEEK